MDTNVFIYAFECPDSNSTKIIDLLNRCDIEVFVSSKVVHEVMRYFERFHSVELARLFRRYLLEACRVVAHDDVVGVMRELRGQIKEKDLEQLAATRTVGLKYLVAYDRDLNDFSEYITPKKFIDLVKLPISQTEY